MQVLTIEERCDLLRENIEMVKSKIVSIVDDTEMSEVETLLEGDNIPDRRNANMKENLTLAFRHVEDAKMRLGAVIQAYQGGISILDKPKGEN